VAALGEIADEQGEHERAAERSAACLAVFEELGDARRVASYHCRLARLALARGAPEQAVAQLRKGVLGAATYAGDQGDWGHVAFVLGAAAALGVEHAGPHGAVAQGYHDQLVATAGAQLSAADFAERWSAGERAPHGDLIRAILDRV
ncbi:MAG TPA: hypothetical protein PKD53_07095, partial [Chloroflexaceae bacterium]|nr:hypothetical protein [Chloroflexaceae bacterium]